MMTTNKQAASARALALQTLCGVGHGQYGNLAVDTVLRRYPLSEADKHLFTALVYGVLERQVTLDFLISRFSARTVSSLDETTLNALRLGLYQLIYMNRIPDHAAVGETVALVPRRVAGYVNAVLRAYLRFIATLPNKGDGSRASRENTLTTPAAWQARFPELSTDGDQLLARSVAFGMPIEICRRIAQVFDSDRANAILRAFEEKPPLSLRVNPLRTSTSKLCTALSALGLSPTVGRYAPHAVLLPEGTVTALPGFDTGDFFVQDEASQLCVELLDAHPGHTVIDTCACPGSKSFGLALNMNNQGLLCAFDLHKSKLSLITAGETRLGINILQVEERDARHPSPALLGLADRVLCDVPCSGLGVMAKKPEIRHKDLSESDRLPAIQAAILEASAGYLKPHGFLVYSTCTLLPEENEQIVTAFLSAHPEFEPVDFTFSAKEASVSDIVSRNGMATLLPDANRTDGFFMAKLKRIR